MRIKITLLLLIILVLSFILPFTTVASEINLGVEESYVMDTAGLLTLEQQRILESRARELSTTYPCEVRIVTLNNIRDFDYSVIEYFAYNMYLEYDFGYGKDKDCVLFVLSTTNREYDFRVWGDYAKNVFTLYGIDDILDNHILKELGNNDYYVGFASYLDRSEIYFRMAERGKPFDRMTDPATKRTILIVTAFFALTIAQFLCGRWKKQMITTKTAKTAGNYIPAGGFRLIGQSDVFTYRTITSVRIDSDSSSSGGGSSSSSGGSGGSSGRSGNY